MELSSYIIWNVVLTLVVAQGAAGAAGARGERRTIASNLNCWDVQQPSPEEVQ